MKIYKVGGAVRDKLLNHPVKDVDWVVVGATVEELLAQNYTQVGRDFPVFLHPQTREEYALARTERKINAGYTGFQVSASPEVTLEEDLRRRDLTINAMAEDSEGTIIDPFNGKSDLESGILRHVSPAFIEDPVRVLRLARFAARLNFTVAPETVLIMQQLVNSGELDALVPERVWQETVKALGEKYPHRFFEVMRECGALSRIFPEVDCLFGVPQTAKYHPEVDTGIHIMLCLMQARKMTEDTQIIFAVLTHDLGKGTTPAEILPKHIGHEERSVDLIEALCARCRVPTHYRELAILVAKYHSHCHRADELNSKNLLKTIERLDSFRRPERLEQFVVACKADSRGRFGFENETYPQADIFREAFQAACQVKVSEILLDGYVGESISMELRHRRIHAIAELKNQRYLKSLKMAPRDGLEPPT
jgi:tRNA nucleotidyltransferase (CCA-adding enzyme)